MAWQLIYTSSARLLEAGRTGFGTVARHPAISALLTGKLESISQFARLPGYDPERIIFSHRIMEAGNRSFHVLSSIRSAGSDYSGRTNHIAHHLVVSDEEVRDLSRRSVTPVDIIQAMDWRTTWDSAARFLEASEEVDLSQLQAHSFNVWAGVTGLADHARLPWSAQAGKGCSIVIPNHADASCFAGEALMHNPAKAWDISFTTHLEPNDGLSDFRWVFLYPDSAARAQAEQSARPLYDLLVPSQLPAPPAPFVQAVSAVAPSPSRQAAPLPTFAAPPPTGLDQGSQWGMDKLVDAKAGRKAIPGTPLMVAGRSATTPAQKNSRKWAFVAASLIIVAVAAFTVIHLLRERAELQSRKTALLTRIDKVWSRVLDGSQKSDQVEQVNKASADSIKAVEGAIKELEVLIESVDLSLKSRADQTIAISSNDASLESFRSLPISVKAWLSYQGKLRQTFNPDALNWNTLSTFMDKENEAWGKIQSTFRARENPHQELREEAKSFVIKVLREKTWRLSDYNAAMTVLNSLGQDAVTEVKSIMECWGLLAEVNSHSGERLGDSDYQRWKKTAGLPKWLIDEVEKLRPPPQVIAKQTPVPDSEPMKPIQAPPLAVQTTPESKAAKPAPKQMETYFVILKSDGSIESPVLPIKSEMVLEVQSLEAKTQSISVTLENGKVEGKLLASPARMAGEQEGLIFDQRRLVSLPSSGIFEKKSPNIAIDCRKPFRILARLNGQLSFEVIALSHQESPVNELMPTLKGKVVEDGKNGYNLVLDSHNHLMKWPENSKILYALQEASPIVGKELKFIKLNFIQGYEYHLDIKSEDDKNRSILLKQQKDKEKQLSALDKKLEKLNEKRSSYVSGIKKTAYDAKERIDEIDNKDIPTQKAAKSSIEKEIEAIKQQINLLPSLPPKPAPGTYHLMARIGERIIKLCLVDLN